MINLTKIILDQGNYLHIYIGDSAALLERENMDPVHFEMALN